MNLLQVFPIIVAAAICLVSVLLLVRCGGLSSDVPNQRSSHQQITGRGAGLAIIFGTLGAYLMLGDWNEELFAIVSGFVAMGVVGAVEDRWGLKAGQRLLLQLILAMIMATVGFRWQVIGFGVDYMWQLSPMVSWVLSVLWIVWVTNLYNFMDGINGIATVEGLVLCLFFAAFAAFAGDVTKLNLIVSCAAALLVFLPFNFPKARIFLGDVGSLPLGFLFAVLALALAQKVPNFEPMIASLVMAPFFYDAFITMALRLKRGENIFQAHRQHFYQKMTRLDQGRHWRTTIFYGSQSLIFAGVCGFILLNPATHPLLAVSLIAAASAMLALIWFLVYLIPE